MSRYAWFSHTGICKLHAAWASDADVFCAVATGYWNGGSTRGSRGCRPLSLSCLSAPCQVVTEVRISASYMVRTNFHAGPHASFTTAGLNWSFNEFCIASSTAKYHGFHSEWDITAAVSAAWVVRSLLWHSWRSKQSVRWPGRHRWWQWPCWAAPWSTVWFSIWKNGGFP